MNELAKFTTENGVAVITIDNPPVNALSTAVANEIGAAIERAAHDPTVRAVVLIGAGRTFVAGADIKELEDAALGRGPGAPNIHQLLKDIEDCPKPVVVAIHGTALGGGVELAMAGHYRVASPDAQAGQPEVNLGIIPGAEGTQRLPRLVGVEAALDMFISGKPLKAPEALQLGLFDKIVEGDLRTGAVAFARQVADSGGPHRRTRDRNEKLGTLESNKAILAGGREKARKTRRNMIAPLRVIDAVEAAITLPFEEGCKREREIVELSLAGDEARALIHAFFAERAVSKIRGISPDTPAYNIRKAAVIGAGTMGGGIAMVLANAGIPVVVKETEQAALDRGMAAVRRNYDSSVKRGRLTAQEVEERIASIRPQLTYDGFADADIIIEAVFENMALKKQVFAEIDKIAKADCVLASNTSTLDIDEIAGATSRPNMVIGIHFFSPAHVMRLVEVVRGGRTGKEVIATAMSLAKKLRKVGVLVGNTRGFVGNRMMLPYMREAQFLVEEGATPSQVDQALTDFGMAMGIFAVDDLGGIDLGWRVLQDTKRLAKPGDRMPLVLEKLYEAHRWGQKTGAGWYRYEDGRTPIRDPEVEALIEATAKQAGIARRSITNDEIIERCLYVMINEGARILEEGIAQRAADIDTIYITGYGFPAYRGGPMWYADTIGLKKIHERIVEFHRRHGDYWTPAPLLERLAREGKTFASLDAEP